MSDRQTMVPADFKHMLSVGTLAQANNTNKRKSKDLRDGITSISFTEILRWKC